MNPYVTGAVIKELREKHHMTQAELAEILCVSDKTVSKYSFYHKNGWSLATHLLTGQIVRKNNNRVNS